MRGVHQPPPHEGLVLKYIYLQYIRLTPASPKCKLNEYFRQEQVLRVPFVCRHPSPFIQASSPSPLTAHRTSKNAPNLSIHANKTTVKKHQTLQHLKILVTISLYIANILQTLRGLKTCYASVTLLLRFWKIIWSLEVSWRALLRNCYAPVTLNIWPDLFALNVE